MALLIVDLDKHIGNAQAWRDTFAEQIPELAIRIWPDAGELSDIEYLAFMHPDFDMLPAFPNLKAMFSRAAGVDDIVKHPKLPKVPLGKMEPPGGDPMMTEYVVMHVLRFHRDMPGYQAAQARREWRRVPIARPEQRRVGFLGFGMMAKAPALVLKSLGFPVSAWVRSPRQAAEVPIFHGADQLEPFLNQTDIAVCLLPLTPETEGIFCARTFAMMPKGAMLVNVGRGKHVVDKDLIAALDSGQLSYAALDALWPEPLPPESPLWLHPKITVMPHVARRPTVGQLVTEIVANIRSLEAGGRLLQEVDLALGILIDLASGITAKPALRIERKARHDSRRYPGSLQLLRQVGRSRFRRSYPADRLGDGAACDGRDAVGAGFRGCCAHAGRAERRDRANRAASVWPSANLLITTRPDDDLHDIARIALESRARGWPHRADRARPSSVIGANPQYLRRPFACRQDQDRLAACTGSDRHRVLGCLAAELPDIVQRVSFLKAEYNSLELDAAPEGAWKEIRSSGRPERAELHRLPAYRRDRRHSGA